MRLALALSICALAMVPISWGADPPNAADLEAELVCPVCETTLDQSTAPVAERMKLFIREQIALGQSEQEIKDALVAEFGPAVIATPPKSGFGLVAWLLPIGALIVGAIAVGWLVLTWSRRRASPGHADPEPSLDPDLERRVDEELARFEG